MVDDGVTIRLGVKQPNSVYTTGGRTIKVTRDEEPPGSGFTRYTHKDEHNQPFILAKIQDNQNYPIDINQLGGKEVTSVAAYYWTGNASNVLMVGVTTGNTTTYYGNRKSDGSNEWIELTGYKHSHPPLINDDIERTLDDLVCSSYGAVTMDLSKGTSFSGNKPYCCRCDDHNNIKITVNRGAVPASSQIEYCKHSIEDPKHKLAKIRYYLYDSGDAYNTNNHKNRRRIKPSNLELPTSDVTSISAFYCGGNPVLIYIDGTTATTGWYKKNGSSSSSNSRDEQWDRLKDGPEKSPDKITICGSNDLEKLKNAIYCASAVKCPIPLPAESGLTPGSLVVARGNSGEPLAAVLGLQADPLNPGASGKPIGNAGGGGKAGGHSTDRRAEGGSSGQIPLQHQIQREESTPSGAQPAAGTRGNEGFTFQNGPGDKGTEPQEPEELHGLPTVEQILEMLGGAVHLGSALTADATRKLAKNTTDKLLSDLISLVGTAGTEDTTQLQPPTSAPSGNETSAAQETAAPGGSPRAEALGGVGLATLGTMSLGSISGISSGTLAGAGATFFGGWKLYNRYKGDPWVRQI
ncbi:hypothetical protein BEWA_020810 [Theileria equi strain WA]|uniref:Uncharacterized protein n=1 Tax=Theileria equi strain WA TaxID=1537102 RepID=L0AWE9_THEEQ|nr:hypothetical protein BEWA_020810 [Theileria equi strain WA]AFZ79234.1 hypothetical protein BEWA_020810 [Theileria equi strain WA]|eukprot:XP_004828900.1 hypothetical protein BEWA_020810 [Theileria equi strain WA]